MIAITDPVSPHESLSTSKEPSSTTSTALRMAPMATTQPTASEPPTDNQRGSETGSDSAAGAVKEEKGEDEGDFDSDDSEFGDDKASDEFELLTLDDLGDGGGDAATSATPTAGAEGAVDAPPVKRIVRRKRKRMSEEERRVRHREVQRQFMKRKRARLAEMRKFIRGLDSQLRLLQAMSDRARLEKENTDMKEMLASPGSGWTWDDAPSSPKEPQSVQAHRQQQLAHQHPMYPQSIMQVMPGHQGASHMIGFHPLGHLSHHASVHTYANHVPHEIHYQMPHSIALHTRHSTEHRLAQPGVPLPWDDIFDAVSTDNPGAPTQDFSF